MSAFHNSLVNLAFIILIGISLLSCSSKKYGQRFDKPEDILVTFTRALETQDKGAINQLFGSSGDELLQSGDSKVDEQRRKKFMEKFKEYHSLQPQADGSFFLVIGNNKWPFPVPIIPRKGGWYFDTETGIENIRDRAIGHNEFKAIESMNLIYLSQRSYSAKDWDNDGRHTYASKIISSPGKRDGLYWPVAENEEPSPLGPVIAKAAEEDFVINESGEPQPYMGYYFRIYPDSNSNTLNQGFLAFAFPASYGQTGIMAFAIDQRGSVYEKDLKKDIEVAAIMSITIDSSWVRVR